MRVCSRWMWDGKYKLGVVYINIPSFEVPIFCNSARNIVVPFDVYVLKSYRYTCIFYRPRKLISINPTSAMRGRQYVLYKNSFLFCSFQAKLSLPLSNPKTIRCDHIIYSSHITDTRKHLLHSAETNCYEHSKCGSDFKDLFPSFSILKP